MDHPNHSSIHSLKGELTMMLSLQNVEKTTTPGETKLLASEILQSFNMANGDSFSEIKSHRRKAQFFVCLFVCFVFLGTTYKHSKTVVLDLDSIDVTSQRNLCEEGLLKSKGVYFCAFRSFISVVRVSLVSSMLFSSVTCAPIGIINKSQTMERAQINSASALESIQVMKAQQAVKSENTPVEVEQNTELPTCLRIRAPQGAGQSSVLG
ncbi:unnamed protein product [Nyctereutes procyonoides]|uniref:(raccoon dog) hypothetical protein n=1 Tax=Nyctereutes procyonoides TaxID=34880 RepID=A0A811YN49_NYCPR|nr:unnamed protein product [Nyctereutes procyonoides]